MRPAPGGSPSFLDSKCKPNNDYEGDTMAEDVGLFEAIYSQRAIRYFKPDPFPTSCFTS